MAEIENWLLGVEERWHNLPDFQVDPEKLKHLAIICDGNRRAAVQRNLNPYLGHRVGVEIVRGVSRASRAWGIDTLTFWVWSTENWQRDSEQVEFVMALANEFLPSEDILQELLENQVRFTHFGRKDRLPYGLGQTISNLELKTALSGRFRLNLCLDYGGLDEMVRAILRMKEGHFDYTRLREDSNLVLQFLDSGIQPAPDLVIRTGVSEGEVFHTSGFMPLQTAYSGWIFLPDFFPDLKPETLQSAIESFTSYEKRLGR